MSDRYVTMPLLCLHSLVSKTMLFLLFLSIEQLQLVTAVSARPCFFFSFFPSLQPSPSLLAPVQPPCLSTSSLILSYHPSNPSGIASKIFAQYASYLQATDFTSKDVGVIGCLLNSQFFLFHIPNVHPLTRACER